MCIMVYVSRTNIDIDDVLVDRAMRLYRLRSKREAVDLALRRLVGEPMSREEALAPRAPAGPATLPRFARRTRSPSRDPRRQLRLGRVPARHRQPRPPVLRSALQQGVELASTDVVVMEILAGARDEADRDRLAAPALRPASSSRWRARRSDPIACLWLECAYFRRPAFRPTSPIGALRWFACAGCALRPGACTMASEPRASDPIACLWLESAYFSMAACSTSPIAVLRRFALRGRWPLI